MLSAQKSLIYNGMIKTGIRRAVAPSLAMASNTMTLTTRRNYSSKYKEIIFAQEGRDKLAKGVNILAKAVSVTLGPKGRNVLIEQEFDPPKITKDGVTVAKSVELEDKFENLGARIVQDVANKTNDEAGDGTTTATVLARAIFAEGLKNVSAGINPVDLRRGVQKAVDVVVEFLKEQAHPISTFEEIAQVGTISANGDKHIGDLLAEAMKKVGKDGVINIHEGKTLEDELIVTEGMKFDNGYLSPHFITDNKGKKCELENPYILICEEKISTVQDIVPALEIAANNRRPLLIIADDVEGDALATCVLNKIRGQVQVCCIKAPGYGDHRKNNLGDIACLTNATVMSANVELTLDKLTEEHLGSCERITVTRDDTVFLKGAGDKAKIAERCNQIRSIIKEADLSIYEKEKNEERLAKLTGGVAVIKVGGVSEVEVGEKKDRFVDALHATRAAIEEGIVPGGGTALLKASKVLTNLKADTFDQQLGIDLVKKAIQEPCKTIVNNAGGEGAVVVGRLYNSFEVKGVEDKNATKKDYKPFNYGYDAYNGEYCDMLKAGIIDPVKVVRTAIVDASGVASLLTTSECMIVDGPDDEPPAPPAGMPMGMM